MTKNQAQARIDRAERHAAQDMLLAGDYGEMFEGKFSGCSVGCDAWEITESSSMKIFYELDHHEIVAAHDGTEVWFEFLRDTIFEGLPKGRRSWWHIESAKALATMPKDADWGKLRHAVSVAILTLLLKHDPSKGEWSEHLTHAIRTVIDYHLRPLSESITPTEASAAAAAAIGVHCHSREWKTAWDTAWAGAASASWALERAAPLLSYKTIADEVIKTIKIQK